MAGWPEVLPNRYYNFSHTPGKGAKLTYKRGYSNGYSHTAEEVYLVGDDRQTKIREPDEEMYIGNHLLLSHMSTHTSLVNFRNPHPTLSRF